MQEATPVGESVSVLVAQKQDRQAKASTSATECQAHESDSPLGTLVACAIRLKNVLIFRGLFNIRLF